MTARRIAVTVAAAALLPLGGVLGPAAQAAPVPHLQSVTLYYNSTDAPDYVAQIDRAAANWNNRTHNVRLVKRSSATIVIHETNDGRGSYTQTDGHGHGTIYLDRRQVAQGFDPTRIAVHELGHNLGLPDHYSGPCSEVMSGHGPGTSCTNAIPSATEASTVDRNFANGVAAPSARERAVA